MVTYGQWFCEVQVKLGAFSACFRYGDTINALMCVTAGIAIVMLTMSIFWAAQVSWLRYRLIRANRTITAMAMAQSEESRNA